MGQSKPKPQAYPLSLYQGSSATSPVGCCLDLATRSRGSQCHTNSPPYLISTSPYPVFLWLSVYQAGSTSSDSNSLSPRRGPLIWAMVPARRHVINNLEHTFMDSAISAAFNPIALYGTYMRLYIVAITLLYMPPSRPFIFLYFYILFLFFLSRF